MIKLAPSALPRVAPQGSVGALMGGSAPLSLRLRYGPLAVTMDGGKRRLLLPLAWGANDEYWLLCSFYKHRASVPLWGHWDYDD